MDAMQQDQQSQPMQGQEEQGEGNTPENSESGEFTVNPDHVEEGIRKQLNAKQNKDLSKIVDAGNQLLFGKDTHYDVMNGLTDNDDTKLADELGKGAIALASMLFKKSGGTMPQELIIPAGVILLARVSEFLYKTGHKINDEIFHNAVVMFDSGLKQSADPSYKDKVQQAMGDSGAQEQQQAPAQSAQQPMPTGQQPTGLLGG